MLTRGAIVTDHRTLRGMEIKGFIDRNGTAKSRERHWSGATVRICHVQPGPRFANCNWWEPFKYRGKEYRLEYFDGCFHCFVVELGKPKPKFV